MRQQRYFQTGQPGVSAWRSLKRLCVQGSLLLRLRAGVLCVSPVIMATVCTGCESEDLNEVERQELYRIFETGSAFEGDPYVRAETLRVLEFIADPRHVEYAIPRLEDSSDMVKVAALRVLLVSKHNEAEREALSMYTRSTDKVREAILSAAEEYGPESLKQELYAQAMRSKKSKLRMYAFEKGMVERFDAADKEERNVELIPALSKLVDGEDDDLASGALRKLIEVGREDRAEPLLAVLQNKEAPIEKRLRAARILWMAQYKPALSAFEEIASEVLEEPGNTGGKRGRLKLPLDKTDKRLLRQAVLGAASLGDETYVLEAKKYLESAEPDDTLEVLSALSYNPSDSALVSLKIAMQDARPEVRHEAIALYSARKDADSKAMINALRQDDQMAKRLLATQLVQKFPKAWSKELTLQFNAPETRKVALNLLRDVIDPKVDQEILALLKDSLAEMSKGEDEELASTAAYLLLLGSEGSDVPKELLSEQSNVQTRYVLMEHMVKTDPTKYTKMFRQYLYNDLYALRLMSAAGLWCAFKDSPALQSSSRTESAPEGEVAGEESKAD